MTLSDESNLPTNPNQGGVIPADQGDAYKSWLLPDISAEKVISSAEKIKRDKEKFQEKNNINRKDNSETIEVIEDITVQPHTAEQLKEITEAAEKEGYESGYQKGLAKGEAEAYQVGLDAAKVKIANDSEHLHNVMEALLIPLEVEHKKLEKFILQTVQQLTKIVIQRELLTDSSIIQDVVKSTLQIIPNPNERLTLYLNPSDIALLKTTEATQHKQHLYQADATLLPGGCRLESNDTSIDASIEQRIEQVLDDFLHQRYTGDLNAETEDQDNADIVEAETAAIHNDQKDSNTVINTEKDISPTVNRPDKSTSTVVGTDEIPTDKPTVITGENEHAEEKTNNDAGDQLL